MHDYSLSDLLQLIQRPDPETKRLPIFSDSILKSAELIEMLEYKTISIQRVPYKNPPRGLPAEEQTMFDKGIIVVNESISPKPAHREAYEFIRAQSKPRMIGWYLVRLPYRGIVQRAMDNGLMQSHKRWFFYETILTEKGSNIVRKAKLDIDTYLASDAADTSKLSNQSCLIIALLVNSYTWNSVYSKLYKGRTKAQKIALQEKVILAANKAQIKGDTDNNLELILNGLSHTYAVGNTIM